MKLECFTEAVKDDSRGLTVAAVTGVRKQSVGDAEKLFGPKVMRWMSDKGYSEEAKLTEVVLNWHRASDELDLSELARCRYNYAMLNYILGDLMPWHKENYNFSRLEVNTYKITTML